MRNEDKILIFELARCPLECANEKRFSKLMVRAAYDGDSISGDERKALYFLIHRYEETVHTDMLELALDEAEASGLYDPMVKI
jgi:hypothetical protein